MAFKYALNTSTISGYKLGIVEQIAVTAKAGYQAIEPWLNDVDAYTATGGTCAAAPPFGNVAGVPLEAFAERYARLCAIGQTAGVTPLLELWGHSPKLSTLAEVLYVAAASGRAEARLLLDVYHIYKGGNTFASLRLLSASAIGLFHVNDYPAQPPRMAIADKHRVWPGDGIAPLAEIAGLLRAAGYSGFLSVELFNPDYWRSDALSTARTGLERTRAAFDGGC